MPRKPTGQPPGRRPRTATKAEHILRVRITADELDRLEYDARTNGQTVSEYVRSKCLPSPWDHLDGTEEM